MFDKEKLLYLAGIMDGEGCIGIELQRANKSCRKVDYYIPRVAIINSSYPLIEWLTNNFGGKYHTRKKETGKKIIYVWNVFGQHMEDIIRELIPYLIVKSKAANIILRYRETIGDEWNIPQEIHAKRLKLYQEMRSVNKVGD